MLLVGKYTKPCGPPDSYTACPRGIVTRSSTGRRAWKSTSGIAASSRLSFGECPGGAAVLAPAPFSSPRCPLPPKKAACALQQAPAPGEPAGELVDRHAERLRKGFLTAAIL